MIIFLSFLFEIVGHLSLGLSERKRDRMSISQQQFKSKKKIMRHIILIERQLNQSGLAKRCERYFIQFIDIMISFKSWYRYYLFRRIGNNFWNIFTFNLNKPYNTNEVVLLYSSPNSFHRDRTAVNNHIECTI